MQNDSRPEEWGVTLDGTPNDHPPTIHIRFPVVVGDYIYTQWGRAIITHTMTRGARARIVGEDGR